MKSYVDSLEGIHDWSEDKLELALRQTVEKLGISSGKLIHPVRLALTGIGFGPSLFELMRILGKDICLRRLKIALEKLPQNI